MTIIRRLFYLTPRDVDIGALTVEQIAELMTPADINPDDLPSDFAEKVSTLLDNECEEHDKDRRPPALSSESV